MDYIYDIDDQLISIAKERPYDAIISAVEKFFSKYPTPHPQTKYNFEDRDYLTLLEYYYFLRTVVKSKNLADLAAPDNPGGNNSDDTTVILKWMQRLKSHASLQNKKNHIEISSQMFQNRFEIEINNIFHYEFSAGDISQIQSTINSLRGLITEAKELEQEHRERLLKRLEKLQSEVHKTTSDLDRFWGLIGDAGVVLGKLGTDSKPIVDRIRELAEIVWRTQARAEELPSDAPFPRLTNKH
ncbi:MAG: hypothetical protein LWW83_15550 [Azonexaceae bacterium]|nr:hypothetical protein [Azonexaceae bacterium]